MRVTTDGHTGDTVFEDDGTPEVTDLRRTPEQAERDAARLERLRQRKEAAARASETAP